MTPAVLLAVFAAPVGWGFGVWLYTHCRDSRRMRRAFAAGRAAGVVRHIRTAGGDAA